MRDARRLPRTVSHLAVAGLVIASVFVGVSASSASLSGRSLFDFVGTARGAGAGDNLLEAKSAHFDLAPDPNERNVLPEGRVAPVAVAPTPLPTPVPPAKPRIAARPQIVSGNGMLLWPVPGGRITQYFSSVHEGLDIGAPAGTTVLAADAGTVIWAAWKNNGGGLVIDIDHGDGIVTSYNHLGSIWVTVGQVVSRGEGIAAVGCTGVCTGPHVHFAVIVNGILVNPLRYL